jgi:hypothetical protein
MHHGQQQAWQRMSRGWGRASPDGSKMSRQHASWAAAGMARHGVKRWQGLTRRFQVAHAAGPAARVAPRGRVVAQHLQVGGAAGVAQGASPAGRHHRLLSLAGSALQCPAHCGHGAAHSMRALPSHVPTLHLLLRAGVSHMTPAPQHPPPPTARTQASPSLHTCSLHHIPHLHPTTDTLRSSHPPAGEAGRHGDLLVAGQRGEGGQVQVLEAGRADERLGQLRSCGALQQEGEVHHQRLGGAAHHARDVVGRAAAAGVQVHLQPTFACWRSVAACCCARTAAVLGQPGAHHSTCAGTLPVLVQRWQQVTTACWSSPTPCRAHRTSLAAQQRAQLLQLPWRLPYAIHHVECPCALPNHPPRCTCPSCGTP